MEGTMKHLSILFLAGLLMLICLPVLSIAQPAPYIEGSVWDVTLIKVKHGMGDEYLRSLASTWKVENEEAKKQGLILSYKILSGSAANETDWDLMLMVEFKNMASLDGADEKFRAIDPKIYGTEEQMKTLLVKRVEIREVFGDKLMRELILK
jgi:hypothetical protein